MTRLILIGGGRLAGLLYATFHTRYGILGYVDDVYPDAYLTRTYGARCLGTSAALGDLKATGARVVVAITDPGARQKYWDLAEQLGLTAETLIFPTATVDPYATVGPGCIVRHQAVVSAQVRLGKNCVVSDLAYVGHDTVVGDHCYLSPGSTLNGSVSIGDGTFVGTNAVVLPKCRVGARCTVAASACVTADVADDGRVGGVPARPLRRRPRVESAVESDVHGPPVSVLMSAYNHEKHVGQAIQSVLDQTFGDFEFLIADDGSTDGTVEVIRSFQDPRIRFTPLGHNHGLAEAKHRLMAQARGRYVSIQNSDDIHRPGKLAAQLAFLESNPDVAVVFTVADALDDEGASLPLHPLSTVFRQENRTREAWLNRFFHDGNCLCASSAVAHRGRIQTLGYLDKRLRQLTDLDLWVRVCMAHPIHVLPELLTGFRIRSTETDPSAQCPELLVRDCWEFTRILGHYLTIPDEATFLRIFPEAAHDVDPQAPMDADLIAFAVAMLSYRHGLAQGHGHPRWEFFALDTLHDLLGDETRARKIHERFKFDTRDLIALTGRLDVFDVLGGRGRA